MALRTLRRLCDSPALTRSGRKHFRDRRKPPIVTVADKQINLDGAPSAQILRASSPIPPCFPRHTSASPAPLCFRPNPLAISRQDDGGISLVAMANAKMDAVQIQDTPVLEASGALATLQIVASGSG